MTNLESKYLNLLWKSFLDGDNSAFSLLYEKFAPELISFGYRFNLDREIVNDSIQEVFIDLFIKRKKVGHEIKELKPYLFVALKNNLLKKKASKKKSNEIDFDSVINELVFEIEYSHQDIIINDEKTKELSTKLKAAIQKLTPKQKEIIYLRFEGEFDYPEISKILNITIESARKQLYRAIKVLRENLDSEVISLLMTIFSKKNH